ncbi:hypothetical protein B0H17DRAFT_1134490 [Mycena rosella]|uniref:Uncharacterized protein n=1 Tax=Mycena rosella TaxID=1033263 RepID=A0AAD7DFK4_MYCRO|nr:hypothetical protein B0H17DRAFT_1134490 [Mycena rosella]
MDPRNLDDDALTRLLRMTTELLIYSRLAGRLVTSSWPTRNGIKIRDKGLTSYLRGCGLFMECFCAFQSDSLHPKSCQIVVSNVTQDVLDAALKIMVFSEFHRDPEEIAFDIVLSRPSHSWYKTHRRQSAPVARPSRIAMDPVSQRSSPSSRGDAMEEKEAKNLRRLIDGQGVSEEVWDEIVERCAKCSLTPLRGSRNASERVKTTRGKIHQMITLPCYTACGTRLKHNLSVVSHDRIDTERNGGLNERIMLEK